MTDFDLYCASVACPPRVGQRMWLDGIDGFFDQYFEGREPGDVIEFLLYPYGPGAAGISAEQLAELPLVSGRIVGTDQVGGTIEVMHVVSLGAWLRALPTQATVLPAELADRTRAPIAALLAEASGNGSALWAACSKRWANLEQVTAVYAVQLPDRARVAVLRTNAVPAWVADTIAGAG